MAAKETSQAAIQPMHGMIPRTPLMIDDQDARKEGHADRDQHAAHVLPDDAPDLTELEAGANRAQVGEVDDHSLEPEDQQEHNRQLSQGDEHTERNQARCCPR